MFKNCTLCPRSCGVNREEGRNGVCRMGAEVRIARAALHMWEEPCISGEEGSGTVFFTGCPLGCVFCQNQQIAHLKNSELPGWTVTEEELASVFLDLQAQKANNINLVTGTHFVPAIAAAIRIAREQGLTIPVVYNTSGYEKVETLQLLDGLVDIYLPDFKYMEESTAREYSRAADYPEIAKKAVQEMVRQTGSPEFDARGMMKKGVIVRHLLLPGHVKEAASIVEYLYQTYGDQIYLSLMNQYTPMPQMQEHPLLGRKVTRREYMRLMDVVFDLDIEQAFVQEGGTAKESFIPEFTLNSDSPKMR
ncbi:MAG: radical SAM protein [Eubacteriales bacterium]|nr:radical SAM protein [Eubacteriales bacterium]